MTPVAGAVADFELPAVARAHEPFAIDEAIGDPAAVVWAAIVDHHEPAAAEPGDCDGTAVVTSRDHGADLDGPDIELGDVDPAVVGVKAKLVEELRGDRAHAATVANASDTAGTRWPTGRNC